MRAGGVNERAARYRQRHPERVKASKKRYRVLHADRVRAGQRRYKSGLRAASFWTLGLADPGFPLGINLAEILMIEMIAARVDAFWTGARRK